MVHPLIKKQLEEQLDILPLELQRRVLQYALDLASAIPPGVPGASLLHFAGVISKNELDTMSQAIEEGCEHVDQDAW